MFVAGVLVLGLCCFHPSSGGQHSLQYFYTANTGIVDLPQFIAVGMVDGKQIDWYDSNTKKNMLKQTWMEGVRDENGITQSRQGHEANFINNIQIAMSRFNQTSGVHTFQFMYGCQHDDESGTLKNWYQYGYDGEDLISFDAEKLQYIASVPQAVVSKQKWESEKGDMEFRKSYLVKECVDWLKKYVQYGRSTLERKVPPKVSLLRKDSSDPTCYATGFYPDGVMITWKRDGVEMNEDMDVGETLPNVDGTFQKRVMLKVSPEDKKGVYTCEVEHSSGETIVLKLENGSNLPVIIAVSVVAILLIGAAILVAFMMKKKGYKRAMQSDSGSGSGSDSGSGNCKVMVGN